MTKFAIGTIYSTRGKYPVDCRIVDIHTTTNHAGEIVKQRYVSVHSCYGQPVYDYNVNDVEVARGLIWEPSNGFPEKD